MTAEESDGLESLLLGGLGGVHCTESRAKAIQTWNSRQPLSPHRTREVRVAKSLLNNGHGVRALRVGIYTARRNSARNILRGRADLLVGTRCCNTASHTHLEERLVLLRPLLV